MPHSLRGQNASEFQKVAWPGAGCQTDTVVGCPGDRGSGRKTKECHAEALVAEKAAVEGGGCRGRKGRCCTEWLGDRPWGTNTLTGRANKYAEDNLPGFSLSEKRPTNMDRGRARKNKRMLVRIGNMKQTHNI